MFGFGHGPELIIILVIALIVLGPGKIPEVAQMLGKGIRELRQASSDLQKTFDVQELLNPTAPSPPAAPPVEVSPAPMAATETILPPAEPAATPRRARKRAAPVANEGMAMEVAAPEANGAQAPKPRARRPARPVSDAAASGRVPAVITAAPEEALPGSASESLAKPAARRRTSKTTSEPVSLDAPA